MLKPLRHQRSRQAGAGQAVAVVALALAGGTLLNAQPMLDVAEGMPLGWRRDVATAVLGPVADVSHALRLDVPRSRLDEALGRGPEPLPSPVPTPTPTPAPTPGPSGSPRPSPTPSALRVPTHDDPLRITVVGDSMAQAQGESLIVMADETGAARAELDFRFSSGLTRPDFFDWPGHLAALQAARRAPEVFVVVFGANDAQGMPTPQGALPFGTQAWDRAYAARVDAVMAQLTTHARVYWVGQPIARSDSYSDRMARLDRIYRERAATHPGVTYVDSWSLFTDDHGRYSTYLDLGSGPVRMRLGDGIHLTRAGGDRLAAAVLAAIRHDWRLPR